MAILSIVQICIHIIILSRLAVLTNFKSTLTCYCFLWPEVIMQNFSAINWKSRCYSKRYEEQTSTFGVVLWALYCLVDWMRDAFDHCKPYTASHKRMTFSYIHKSLKNSSLSLNAIHPHFPYYTFGSENCLAPSHNLNRVTFKYVDVECDYPIFHHFPYCVVYVYSEQYDSTFE